MCLSSSLQHRFQGLVLGLAMVPLAIRSQPNPAKAMAPQGSRLYNRAQSFVALSFAQFNTFLQQPDEYSFLAASDVSDRQRPGEAALTPELLISVLPGLLRYHTRSETRTHWLKSHLGTQPEPVYELVFYVGDLLSLALEGPLGQRRETTCPPAAVTSAPLYPAIAMTQRALTAHPLSYCASVQQASTQGALAATLTGLMYGACGGRAALPLRWQTASAPLPVPCPEQLALANGLFEQWAGITAGPPRAPAITSATTAAARTY